MSAYRKLKGTWGQRILIFVLSIVFGVSFFWLLGFITSDIGELPGPHFNEIEAEYINAGLFERQKSLKANLDGIEQNIINQSQRRNILKDSTDNLQNTINQLLSIQKLNLEYNRPFSEESQKTLSESQSLFLENQRQYQILNKTIAELTSEKQDIERELSLVSDQIEQQREPAREEYTRLRNRHRLKIATLKLVVLVPVFLLCAWFFIKKRTGLYGAIVYAAFIASLVKMAQVVHQYFPKEYFKYIALFVIIGIVLKILIYVLKSIIAPKKSRLIKQYQQQYDKNLCPVCGKPILIGPLRYASVNRRKPLVLLEQGAKKPERRPYSCPSCGTRLYEKCDKCNEIRHSLLPFCEHCGNEKQLG
ncbi:hypothetical protein ACFL1G_03490 [Planctomycetota bacterium]